MCPTSEKTLKNKMHLMKGQHIGDSDLAPGYSRMLQGKCSLDCWDESWTFWQKYTTPF